jgi:hypothetical protein
LREPLVASEVIDRMREALLVATDAELSEALGVSKTTVSSWRTRNSVPFEACVRAAAEGITDLLWVLTGREYETPKPSVHEGEIDFDLLRAAIYSRYLVRSSNPGDAAYLAEGDTRFVINQYNRFQLLLEEATKLGQLSRTEFFDSLYKSIRKLFG